MITVKKMVQVSINTDGLTQVNLKKIKIRPHFMEVALFQQSLANLKPVNSPTVITSL